MSAAKAPVSYDPILRGDYDEGMWQSEYEQRCAALRARQKELLSSTADDREEFTAGMKSAAHGEMPRNYAWEGQTVIVGGGGEAPVGDHLFAQQLLDLDVVLVLHEVLQQGRLADAGRSGDDHLLVGRHHEGGEGRMRGLLVIGELHRGSGP